MDLGTLMYNFNIRYREIESMPEKSRVEKRGGIERNPSFIVSDAIVRAFRYQELERVEQERTKVSQWILAFRPEYTRAGDLGEGSKGEVAHVVVERTSVMTETDGGQLQGHQGLIIAARGGDELVRISLGFDEEGKGRVETLTPFLPLTPREIRRVQQIALELMWNRGEDREWQRLLAQKAAGELLELLGLPSQFFVTERSREFFSEKIVFASSDREGAECPICPSEWVATVVSGAERQCGLVADFQVLPRGASEAVLSAGQEEERETIWFEVASPNSEPVLTILTSTRPPLAVPPPFSSTPLVGTSLKEPRIPDHIRDAVLDRMREMPQELRPNLSLLEVMLVEVLNSLRGEGK